MDSKAIVCHGAPEYATKFCWIHGTGYIDPIYQNWKNPDRQTDGVTVCVSDATADDPRAINYYLWLPLLLVALLGLAKLSRTVWKGLEGGLVASIVTQDDQPEVHPESGKEKKVEKGEKMGKEFLKHTTSECAFFQLKFFFCEILNIVCVFVSMYVCDELLINKFWSYGIEVAEFMKKSAFYVKEHRTPDPKCNLFPTEVSCDFRTVSLTGQIDSKNYICILGNNVFNQHYFFVLWMWWVALLVLSFLFMIYRVARLPIPTFNKFMFNRRIGSHSNLSLTPAQIFVLDRVANNVDRSAMEKVLETIVESKPRGQMTELKVDMEMGDAHLVEYNLLKIA